MNKMLLKSASVLTTCLVVGPMIAGTVSAASTGGDYTSNGYVNFEEGDNTGISPVDPLNPTVPVGPTNPDGTDPAPGTGGALSIDFASSLSFGTQKISSNDATYYAHAQWISKDKDGNDVDITRPNYVQVTDTRGTWDGWTLTVAESDQFQNSDGDQLTGAELSFSKGYTEGTTAATPGYVNTDSFTVGTAATKILGAGTNQGMGTWVYGLGGNADYQENGGPHLDNDAVSTASPITLKVIAGTNKATAYTTQLNWSLTNAPGN
ncbi:WxL domain-containing protein [Lactococcus allomyrinae]|uniref:WxL domain-containing protein n=1 Tax=Lactococcus allomyrinae TaxID=2419773 RepID=A0A387BE83_9LACT|nr:WxL domain-containing protein [Lactococcus allomyrinae]AYG00366.1 WxL domain-containing protein [Lactococcus allomyrinae]AYG00858.1 WxL domain-containing protein [Lactococcus allomyrinae]